MKHYTDIFFDLDDTLLDTFGNSLKALEELFVSYSLERNFESLDEFRTIYWMTNNRLWSLYACQEIDWEELTRRRMHEVLSEGHDINITEKLCQDMTASYYRFIESKHGVVEGAHDILEYLKGKSYHLHICSNGFRAVQSAKLRAAGLDGYFDSLIFSEDAKAPKPSRTFFDYAILNSGARRESTIMIGDNYETDINGAMSSGIDAMLLNRWQSDFVPPVRPEYIVTDLNEIQDIL